MGYKRTIFILGFIGVPLTFTVGVLQTMPDFKSGPWMPGLVYITCCSVVALQTIYTLANYDWQSSHEKSVENQRRDLQLTLTNLYKSIEVNRLPDQSISFFKTRADLYEQMISVIARCVNTTPHSPWQLSVTSFFPNSLERPTEDAKVLEYHASMRAYIKNINGPFIRRIVSIPTRNKFEWVKKQLEEYRGCEHFSLRWHVQSSSLDEHVMIPLNIQIYGGDDLFICSPRSNNRNIDDHLLDEKHVHFHSRLLVNLFAAYYEQLWKACEDTSLIDQGVVNKKTLQRLVEHSKTIPDDVPSE